jgi:hypothetical protein
MVIRHHPVVDSTSMAARALERPGQHGGATPQRRRRLKRLEDAGLDRPPNPAFP